MWLAFTIIGLSLLAACGDSTATTGPAVATTTTAASPTVPATTALAATTAATTAAPTTAATVATTTPATTTRSAATSTPVVARTATPSAVTTAAAQAQPTTASQVVTDVTPPPLGSAEGALRATGFNPEEAKALLDELSRQVGIRVVGTEGELKTLDWLEQKYRSYGYTRVERQEFSVLSRSAPGVTPAPPIKGYNVIATRPGPTPDAKVLIFGGHHDTVPRTVGASDNGSGTAVTVELAKVLFNKFPNYELRFINFGGEEVGLLGSKHYVSQMSEADKKRLVAFINIDAVGVGDRFVAIGSPDLVNLAVDTASQNGVRLERFSLDGTGLSSDHAPFMQAGLKAVFFLRYIDPQLHRPGDVSERVYPSALLLAGGMAILTAQKLTGATS